MLIEFIISTFVNVLNTAISLIGGTLTLPLNLISTLQAITGYGAFVVGSDLLLSFFALITFWFTVKITVGIVLFVWRLLPFT